MRRVIGHIPKWNPSRAYNKQYIRSDTISYELAFETSWGGQSASTQLEY